MKKLSGFDIFCILNHTPDGDRRCMDNIGIILNTKVYF